MNYFPISINLHGKDCLVVGGGTIALRKVITLLRFEANIVVISPTVIDEFYSLNIKVILRNFEIEDLNNMFLVVVATNDSYLNQNILDLCNAKNILCNSVTNRSDNGCIFPAITTYGDISVGVTTNGNSPYISSLIRNEISDNVLPKYEKILEWSKALRVSLIDRGIPSKVRSKVITHLIKYALKEGDKPLSEMIEYTIDNINNENEDR